MWYSLFKVKIVAHDCDYDYDYDNMLYSQCIMQQQPTATTTTTAASSGIWQHQLFAVCQKIQMQPWAGDRKCDRDGDGDADSDYKLNCQTQEGAAIGTMLVVDKGATASRESRQSSLQLTANCALNCRHWAWLRN